jgi:methanogenic corrinoid protein MtbC1
MQSITALAAAVAERLNASGQVEGLKTRGFSPGFVQSFATLLVEDRYATAEKILLRLCACDRSYINLAENLLGEASRVVGARWETDEVSFSDVSIVTTSLLRLRQALAAAKGQPTHVARDARALFAALPNQSHTLGLILASEAFRLEGWNVDVILDASSDAIVQRAKTSRPKVVGLTVGRQERVRDVLDLATRLKSLPSPVRILLGGNSVDTLDLDGGREAVDAVVTDIAGALRVARS